MSCPSSIRCRDSNPRPLECESPPITTRPGLPPKFGSLKKKFKKCQCHLMSNDVECLSIKILRFSCDRRETFSPLNIVFLKREISQFCRGTFLFIQTISKPKRSLKFLDNKRQFCLCFKHTNRN